MILSDPDIREEASPKLWTEFGFVGFLERKPSKELAFHARGFLTTRMAIRQANCKVNGHEPNS